MTNSPCLGCKERRVGCHGECQRYKQFCACREIEHKERYLQSEVPVRAYIRRKNAAYFAEVAKRGYRTKDGKAFSLKRFR